MIKLIDLLDEIVQEIKNKGQYDVKNDWDHSLLITEIFLAELLDPENSYEYKERGGLYYFRDVDGIMFGAIMVAYPGKTPFYEFKTFWVDPETKKRIYQYLPSNSSSIHWAKRSDTVAKIFRDEIIPKFSKQEYAKLLVINPVDSKRYQFSIRMVKKFIPKEWEIKEKFPKQIIITKS